MTSENCLNSDNDEEFATTPQIASPEEMARRRVVRVRRPNQAGGQTATSGLFKNLGSTAAAGAQPTTTTGPASGPFSFTSTTSSSSAMAMATKANTSASFSGFSSFGSAANNNMVTPASAAAAAADGTKPPSFFSGFGMVPPNNNAMSTTPEGKPVFPTGAFNFSNAVTTFVEARKKAEEAAKLQGGTGSGEQEDNDNNALGDDEDGPCGPLLKSQSMIQAAPGEVLAIAPSKLFSFDKTAKQWIERGEGDAKLKRETVKAEGDGDEIVHRLLVRDGYSLNAVISEKGFLFTSSGAKHVIFTAGTSEGPTHYLLKFVGPQAEENGKKFTEKLKSVLKQVKDE